MNLADVIFGILCCDPFLFYSICTCMLTKEVDRMPVRINTSRSFRLSARGCVMPWPPRRTPPWIVF